MTIEAQTPRVAYTGNGVTTAFTVSFQFQDHADLQVRKNVSGTVTTPVLDTDYTVTGGDGDTGTVTFLVAPASGAKIIIFADPVREQELDLQEGNASPAESQEAALDRLTTIVQRLQNWASRLVGLNDAYSATFDPKLPMTLTADCVLAINPAGDGIVIGPNIGDISDASEFADAAEAAQAAAEAALAATLILTGVYSIPQTAWTPANNQSATNITGFVINANAKATMCEVWVRTKTDTDERNGIARFMVFKLAAGTYAMSGVQWDSPVGTTRPQITFSLSSNQVQYASSDHTGSNYVGAGEFQGRSIDA